MRHQRRTPLSREHPLTRLAMVALAMSLVVTACAGNDSATNSSGQAAVTVNSIESGCAEAIDLSLLLNGATPPSMNVADMQAAAAGANSLQAAFPDRTSEVGDYFNLISDVFDRAAASAAERGDLTGEQVTLLLDFELAGRRADFERLSPPAEEYFTSKCGTPFTNAMAGVPATTSDATSTATDIAADADATDTTVQDATSKATVDDAPADTTTTTAPQPDGTIDIDTGSVGAVGQFKGAELRVGEIWRTNLTPEAAVTGGSEVGEEAVTLIGIRMTSQDWKVYNSPSHFGLVSSDGFRTNADDAVLESGSDWNLDLDVNESVAGFLVFNGNPEINVLQWIDGSAPVNIILNEGATTQAYPYDIAVDSTPIAGSALRSGCPSIHSTEIRLAQADVQLFGQYSTRHTEENERFLHVDVAMKLDGFEGESITCRVTDSFFIRELGVRLQLANGDLLSPDPAPTGSVDEGSIEVFRHTFVVPHDTTSFTLVDVSGTVLGTWTDIELPEL